jgi:hypothetical protein
LQNTQTPFSLNKAKKQLRKAWLQQNIIKIQALINDSLVKVNSLLGKAEDRKQVLLLTQIASNLLKTQTKLEQLSRFIEKTLLENSSGGNFRG